MAEYLIQDSTLQGIADAIRTMGETTDSIAVQDFASAILAISKGAQVASGTFTSKYSSDNQWEKVTYPCSFVPTFFAAWLSNVETNKDFAGSYYTNGSLIFLYYNGEPYVVNFTNNVPYYRKTTHTITFTVSGSTMTLSDNVGSSSTQFKTLEPREHTWIAVG